MPDVKPQEIKAFAEVTNVGFLARQAQSTRPKPGAQEVLGFDGLFVCGTENHEVIGVPHYRVGPTAQKFGDGRKGQWRKQTTRFRHSTRRWNSGTTSTCTSCSRFFPPKRRRRGRRISLA